MPYHTTRILFLTILRSVPLYNYPYRAYIHEATDIRTHANSAHHNQGGSFYEFDYILNVTRNSIFWQFFFVTT